VSGEEGGDALARVFAAAVEWSRNAPEPNAMLDEALRLLAAKCGTQAIGAVTETLTAAGYSDLEVAEIEALECWETVELEIRVEVARWLAERCKPRAGGPA
jgi:hypothetical protein